MSLIRSQWRRRSTRTEEQLYVIPRWRMNNLPAEVLLWLLCTMSLLLKKKYNYCYYYCCWRLEIHLETFLFRLLLLPQSYFQLDLIVQRISLYLQGIMKRGYSSYSTVFDGNIEVVCIWIFGAKCWKHDKYFKLWNKLTK